MATDIIILKNSGSRMVDMCVTEYSGGKRGTCLQLGAETEEGSYGYVQLSAGDINKLMPIFNDILKRSDT